MRSYNVTLQCNSVFLSSKGQFLISKSIKIRSRSLYPEFSRSNANVRTASSSAPLQVLKLWRLPYAALISLAEDVVRGAFVRVDFQCHKRCCVHRGTRTPTFSVPVASIGVESLPVISFVARFLQVTLTGLDFPLGVFSFTLNPSAESALSAC